MGAILAPARGPISWSASMSWAAAQHRKASMQVPKGAAAGCRVPESAAMRGEGSHAGQQARCMLGFAG